MRTLKLRPCRSVQVTLVQHFSMSGGVRSDSRLAAIGTVELFDFDNRLIRANCLEHSVRGDRLSSFSTST